MFVSMIQEICSLSEICCDQIIQVNFSTFVSVSVSYYSVIRFYVYINQCWHECVLVCVGVNKSCIFLHIKGFFHSGNFGLTGVVWWFLHL